MSRKPERLLFAAALLVIVAVGGCGGGSPAGPSGSLKLQGLVLPDASAVAAQSAGAKALSTSASAVTVTVKEAPSTTVTVSGNGTFELDNLPAGTFTLVFSVNGTVIGEIQVQVVDGATEIKVVVQITQGSVVLVNISFDTGSGTGTGTGNGNDNTGNNGNGKACLVEGGNVGQGIELEGNVASGSSSHFQLQVNGNRSSGLVDVNASGADFKCNGQKKSSDCKATLAAGDKVHVRGTLTSCTTSAASVTATEVMVQK